jgi:hypothetical protein
MAIINSNRKIVYICNKYFYKYLVEYINSLTVHIPNSELMIYNIRERKVLHNYMINNKDDIYVIFRHPLKYIDTSSVKHKYFFNTEQLTLRNWLDKIAKMNMPTIDYSDSNIKCLVNKTSYHIPYQVNYKEIHNYEKIYDVAFIGLMSNKRKDVINKLKGKNINVTMISGWDANRDTKLMKYKILLNIHRSDNLAIFEEIRCNRCVFNNMIVITEKSAHMEDYMLKDYIIECEYDNLVDTVVNTLNNYEEVHKKLFDNFDIKEIEKQNVELLKKFVDDANSIN